MCARAMAKLGGQDQLILSLFYYDDYSVRQIAEALSLSEGGGAHTAHTEPGPL